MLVSHFLGRKFQIDQTFEWNVELLLICQRVSEIFSIAVETF